MNDRRFTKEKDLSGNLDCEKPEEAARAEKIVGGTGNGNDGNDNNANNDRDESKQSFGISGSHSVLKEPTTDEHALKQFMFVCMDTTDGTDSTAFKEASAAVLNGSVGKSGINIAKKSNINNIDVAGESNNDDVDVAGESNINDVDVAGESNIDNVDVAGESNVNDVDVAGESNIDDIDVVGESNINDFAMKNLTTADGENSNTGISADTATDNSVAVNIVATADNSAVTNNVATTDNSATANNVATADNSATANNVAVTATVNNTTETVATTATAAVSAETLISSEPGTNKNTPIVVERVGNKNTTEMQAADIKTGENSKLRLDLLNPNYEYVLSSGIGSYKYDIYVKKCAPEVRDALIFINIATNWVHRIDINRRITDFEIALDDASQHLRQYIYQNSGILRLFFTKTKNYYAFTTGIIYDLIAYKELTLDAIINKINSMSSIDIFAYVISYMNCKTNLSHSDAVYLLSNRNRFEKYFNHAEYPASEKDDIIQMYNLYILNDDSKELLKHDLASFLKDYYEEYKKYYNKISLLFEKERDKIVDTLLRDKCLHGVTDNYMFNDIIQQREAKRSIIIEPMAFCTGCAEYYSMLDWCIICIGYGCGNIFYSSCDYNCIGDKLKYFSNLNVLKLIKLLSKQSRTAYEISDKMQISKYAVYRTIDKLLDQSVIIKERGSKFSLNRQYIENIIKLLEMYGGE